MTSTPGPRQRLRDSLTTSLPAFTYHSFHLFWWGCLFSNIGTWMQELAQPWLVLQLSFSPFLLGIDGFAANAPALLLLPWIGVMADRYDRRLILFLGNSLCLLGALLLTILVATGQVKVAHIIVISFLSGMGTAIVGPAFQSYLPSLVKREHMANAIAMTSVQFNISRVLGPVFGGIALSTLGPLWCFGLNALSFAAFLAILMFMRTLAPEADPERPIDPAPRPRRPSVAAQDLTFRSGLRAMSQQSDIMGMLCVLSVSSFFVGPLLPFLAVLVKNVYHQQAKAFSLALSIFGAGALAAAFTLTWSKKLPRKPWVVEACSLVSASMMLAIAAAPSFPATLPLLAIVGFCFVLSYALANTLIQTSIRDEYRGRFMSFFILTFRGFVPFGTLITGTLVSLMGVKTTFAMGAVAQIILLCIIHRIYFAPRSGGGLEQTVQIMQKERTSP